MRGRCGSRSVGEPEAWLLLEAAAPPAGEAHLLLAALHRLGARAVDREGGRVVALFSPHADPAALAVEAEIAVRASTSVAEPEVTWRRLSPGERAARLGPAPPALGVAGRSIRLEASTAFGTAEHPTTRSCLRLLEAHLGSGDRVLDVGAGSAILAIAAVLLGADRAVALESDPVACAAARRNVALNDVEGRVRVREVAVAPGSRGDRGRYDVVVANIEAGILLPLIPGLAPAVREGGLLILSGVLRAERAKAVAAVRAAGLTVEAEEVDDGWWTGAMRR